MICLSGIITVVIMCLIVNFIINAFSLSLRPFNPKRGVFTIIESFWFSKERLMVLILLIGVFFGVSNFSIGKRSE